MDEMSNGGTVGGEAAGVNRARIGRASGAQAISRRFAVCPPKGLRCRLYSGTVSRLMFWFKRLATLWMMCYAVLGAFFPATGVVCVAPSHHIVMESLGESAASVSQVAALGPMSNCDSSCQECGASCTDLRVGHLVGVSAPSSREFVATDAASVDRVSAPAAPLRLTQQTTARTSSSFDFSARSSILRI